MKPSLPTIVLLADRRHSRTAKTLRNSGYHVLTVFTPDHAVAICVNSRVEAVVLDQEHFIQTDGWSVAQSLKLIRVSLCVILVVRGKPIGKGLPEGVDAMLPVQDEKRLLATLKEFLKG